MTHPAPSAEEARMKRIVLGSLLGFFGVILGANGVMIWLALGSHPGLTQERPFETGLRYDAITAAAEKQAALGWSADLEFLPDEGAGNGKSLTGRLIVTMSGPDGRALKERLTLRAQIERRVESREDMDLPLEPMGPGRYGAILTLPLRGEWLVRLAAASDKGEWQVAKTLMVGP